MIVPTFAYGSSSKPSAKRAACAAMVTRTSSVSTKPRAASQRLSTTSQRIVSSSRARSSADRNDHCTTFASRIARHASGNGSSRRARLRRIQLTGPLWPRPPQGIQRCACARRRDHARLGVVSHMVGGDERPETRFASFGEDKIAYQVFGEGDVDLIYTPAAGDPIDLRWDWPSYAGFLRRLGRRARVVMFDPRG